MVLTEARVWALAALLWVAPALVLIGQGGCASASRAQRVAMHTASNSAARAIGWLDATTAVKYEVESNLAIARFKAEGAGLEAYERWEAEHWNDRLRRIEHLAELHGIVVSWLETNDRTPTEQVRKAVEDLVSLMTLTVEELEQEGIEVPAWVIQGVDGARKAKELL